MTQRDTELAVNYLMSAGVVAYQRAIAHAVGDALAGLFFSQLWYWAGRQPAEREGWFFMTREQLQHETAMTRREQETSRRKLKQFGILEEERRGHPAKLWYRINVGKVIQLIENTRTSQLVRNGPSSWYETAQLDGTKPPNKLVRKRPTSKISTKISTKTAAASAEPTADAAAGFSPLVEELRSHGVGRATAEELARTKPEACRRCLDYLPFAEVKKTKGAWLSNAIRDDYGPPEGWEKAKRQRACNVAGPRKPLRRPETALDSTNAGGNREAYAFLAKTQPEAITAFIRHVESEREKSKRVADLLSPERKAAYLASFDEEEKRLELFGRWLAGASVVPEVTFADHAANR